MFDLKSLIRDNIKDLKPYSSARQEYSSKEGIFLDANECPYGEMNRYPDPLQTELKEAISNLKDIPTDKIFLGNGSDEVIDLSFRIFCKPGIDKALTISPSYGMYDVAAKINDIELVKLSLNDDFSIDTIELAKALADPAIKIFILCSPNNPTANAFPKENLLEILRSFNGIILIDEAYIDFSNSKSWLSELNKLPNLVVIQTFSKSFGLAAARVGVAYSGREIIRIYTNVKPPYNISSLNQKAALESILNFSETTDNIRIIKDSRETLINRLSEIETVRKIYPSDSNFLLVEFADGPTIFNHLISKKIITRNRDQLVRNCIRISVGTPEENNKLIKELKNINYE